MPSNEISTVRRSLAPTTFSEAFEFAQHLAKSSMVPGEYRGKPENILLAMQWGAELGLAPLQAIQNIAIINGKPSVYGDALIALVRGSPSCDDIIETFEGGGDEFAAVCEAQRKGKAPVRSRFSVADAKEAGLWGKSGPWKQYPRRMLQMRARGFALRDAFPDVLRGVITREEADDYPVDVSRRPPIDVTPRADLDAFAALPPVADGGDDALRLLAESTATRGTEAFRGWWATLDGAQRNVVRPDLAEYKRVAEAADNPEVPDEDPFGLPPLPLAPAHDPERHNHPPHSEGEDLEMPPTQGPSAAANSATHHNGGDGGNGAGGEKDGAGPTATKTASPSERADPKWQRAVADLAPQRRDLASDALDWPAYADGFVRLAGRATQADLAAIQLSRLPHMAMLRREDGDSYRRVTEAIAGRVAELGI